MLATFWLSKNLILLKNLGLCLIKAFFILRLHISSVFIFLALIFVCDRLLHSYDASELEISSAKSLQQHAALLESRRFAQESLSFFLIKFHCL